MKVSRRARIAGGIVGALVASLALVSIATGATADKDYGAIVTDTAGLNDRSFNFLANKGRLLAEDVLTMDTRAFISKTSADYLPNLAAAAREAGSGGIVVANGFLLGGDTNTAAGQFKNTNFAIVDFPWVALADKPANAAGLTFKAQESGYLVGYLAALMAKAKGGKQVLSAVGGQKIPSVDSWIAGYRAGAQKVNPKMKVLIAYSGQFPPSAAPKCKEIALAHIARGAQSVFQVAGGCGLGALDAAKQKKVWGIGVDADQSYLGRHILTSGVKRVDAAVFAAFKASQAGTFQGGRDFVFNLKNGGMSVGIISPAVPRALVAAMNAQQKLIINGKVVPPATL